MSWEDEPNSRCYRAMAKLPKVRAGEGKGEKNNMTAKITTLIVKVQDEAVGPVMRALNGWPGVVDIAMDQGPPKKAAKEKRSAASIEGPSRGNLTAMVLKVLAAGKKSRKELRDMVREAGLRPDSISSLIDRLGKQGDIKGSSDGYTLTSQGAKRT